MNVGVHVSFRVSVLLLLCCCLDIYPGVEFLGHMVVLFLTFWGSSRLFSTVTAPIYSPTNSTGRFPFLHILVNIFFLTFYFVLEYSQLTMLRWFQVSSKGTHPCIYIYIFSPKLSSYPGCLITLSRIPCSSPTFVICVLFDDSHSDRCEVMSHCGFNLHFPGDFRSWASFCVDHLHFFFGKMSIKFFCPCFDLVVWFSWCWVVSVVYIYWTLIPYQSCHLQIFFSYSIGCLFILSVVSFPSQKLLSLIQSYLFIFALVDFALGDGSPQNYKQHFFKNWVYLFLIEG